MCNITAKFTHFLASLLIARLSLSWSNITQCNAVIILFILFICYLESEDGFLRRKINIEKNHDRESRPCKREKKEVSNFYFVNYRQKCCRRLENSIKAMSTQCFKSEWEKQRMVEKVESGTNGFLCSGLDNCCVRKSMLHFYFHLR